MIKCGCSTPLSLQTSLFLKTCVAPIMSASRTIREIVLHQLPRNHPPDYNGRTISRLFASSMIMPNPLVLLRQLAWIFRGYSVCSYRRQISHKFHCSDNKELSYLILSYLILSYLILSYLILSYLILSYLILYYIILSYLILSYLILYYLILYYIILYYLILSYLILSYLILSYLILSYLILSYLILSYLILSYLI